MVGFLVNGHASVYGHIRYIWFAVAKGTVGQSLDCNYLIYSKDTLGTCLSAASVGINATGEHYAGRRCQMMMI